MRTSAISTCHWPFPEILLVDEGAPREEVPLEVLHPRFDLALRLRAVGAAHLRLEAPVIGNLFEGCIPPGPALPGRRAGRPRPIVQMLACVAAEVLEGALVGVENLAQGLAEARLVKAPPGVSERQDEHMQRHRPAPQLDAGLAPVDLALLAWRGLEPHRRPLGGLLRRAQRAHEPLHRLVAAVVVPAPAQLLVQDPRGVLHGGGPALQIARVLGQQGVGPIRARIWLPHRRLENAADRLAIEIQLPGDLRLRSPLDVEKPVHFPPAVLTDHAPLPEWCDLEASVAVRRRQSAQQCLAHDRALLGQEGGEFSMTTGGDYWMTADTQDG